MFSSPDRSRLFGRGVRFLPVLLSVALASLVVTCTDAPSVPEGMGYGSLQIMPHFSFAGATTTAVEDALAEAFERVNRFRMVIHRLPSNELALDTVLVVSPGQEVYDLQVDVEVQSTNEQFSVVITALEGDTELFTSDPITVTASAGATGSAAAAVAVTMTYSGPGATAVAVDIDPEGMALGPGSSGTFTATVTDESGVEVGNVPVSWSTGSGAVATVTNGGVATGVGSGVTSVVVTTPTGLSDEASLYVASGRLAFVRDGHVVVGDMMGTETTDQTPEATGARGPAWGPDGSALYYTEDGVVMKVGEAGSRGSGQWPAVSPDGAKVATEQGSTIHFTNEDGTASTAGPEGTAPAWAPGGTHLVVGGGSIEKVKANGQDRETLSSGSGDRLPAVSAAGRVAFLTGGGGLTSMDADGSGKTDVLPAGVTSSSRPTWSVDGELLVYSGSDGLLYIVAADGSTPPVALPQGAGTDPAWQPAGPALSPPALLVEALDPARPVPGLNVDVVGAGFDWIIPSNTHVFFPGPVGEVEGVVLAVTETEITALVPDAVVEGTLRVETLTGEATIAFDPAVGSVLVTAATAAGQPVEGVGVTVLQGGVEVTSGVTDIQGQILFSGLDAGAYDLEITPPSGLYFAGETPVSVVVELGVPKLVQIELVPAVHVLTIEPEAPMVEVGGLTAVTATALDVQGNTITEFVSSAWAGVTPHISASGVDLDGELGGLYPGELQGDALFRIVLNGQVFDFPATVTSYIEGMITKNPPPVSVAGESGAQPAEGETYPPAGDVTVELWECTDEGCGISAAQPLATKRTLEDGTYRFEGLLAGEYEVRALPLGDLSPNPKAQRVTLGEEAPFGVLDFHMSVAPVASVEITPDGGTITAFDGTLQLTAIPRDADGDPLGGRTITWSSDDEGIVAVDGTGMAKSYSNGTANIVAEVGGMTDTVTVTVDQAAATIDIYIDFFLDGTPYADSAFYADTFWAFPGDTSTFKAETKDANGYDVMDATANWSSTDLGVETIGAATGVGAAIAGGTTWVIADMDGVKDSLFLEVRPDTTGAVHINVQADLAAFQAGGYGRINGTLFVDNASVTKLGGMESLLWVTDSVYIQNNTSLTDIDGLRYLTVVEGEFVLQNNSVLTAPSLDRSPPAPSSTPRLAPRAGGPQLAGHLDPKPGFWLLETGTNLRIRDNAALTHLDWLSNLLFVWGEVEIGNNALLADVDGLVTLEHIDGSLVMYGNPSLVSMSAFPALESVGYSVYLEEPGQRISFSSLLDISGEFYMGDWGARLRGDTATYLVEARFPALLCVTDGIWVTGNARLGILDLSALQTVSWMCGGEGQIAPVSGTPLTMAGRGSRQDQSPVSDYVLTARSARTRRLAERQAIREEMAAEREARHSERELPGDDLARREAPVFEEVFQAGPELGSGYAEHPYLDLEYNWALTSIDLRSLGYVEGTFLLWYNPMLPSLNLPALWEIGWDLEILENDLLDDLRAPLLESVGERGSGSLAVFYNPVLPTFNFPNLAYIDNALVVVNNYSLESFALPALDYTGGPGDYYPGCGYYWPYDGGMDSPPQGVVMGPQGYGSVYVEYNDLSGGFDLSSLQTVDALYISGNNGLTSIPSMPHLPEWIDIEVYWNSSLPDLDGFSTLDKAWGIYISSNGALTDISGLGNLTEVGEEGIQMYNNDVLTGVSFPALTVVEGAFSVNYHDILTSMSAPLLTSVGVVNHYFQIYDNPQVSTASFPLLTTINGSLYINTTALTNLNGFSALTSDLTSLYIDNNTVLTDISGLLGLGDADATNPIMSDLYIRSNILLTQTAANAFLSSLNAKFLVGTAVSGTVTISGNDGGG